MHYEQNLMDSHVFVVGCMPVLRLIFGAVV